MARPERGKPSLVSRTMRQQLAAVVVTLLAVIAGLLWLTDRVMLAARRQALRQQLTAVQSADNAVLLLCDLSAEEHAGSVLLDAQGYWRRSGDDVIGGRPTATPRSSSPGSRSPRCDARSSPSTRSSGAPRSPSSAPARSLPCAAPAR
jgi:hypothetical protein